MVDLAEQRLRHVNYASKAELKEIEFALRQAEALSRELRHDIRLAMERLSIAA